MTEPESRPPARKPDFAGPGRLGRWLLILVSAGVLIRIAVDVAQTYGW
ncbi:hypothetical protein [Zavarzinia compransoris]|nr:hypothetical protein [Zavarzinia compransoris]TDP45474.1 hypothetical protein DES42_105179 [Zavarzinia compransoris]